MKNVAIILAGGTGERLGARMPKPFFRLGSKTIIETTIEIFEQHEKIDAVYIVIHPEQTGNLSRVLEENHYRKISKILKGGSTRQQSSAIGVAAVEKDFGKVLIHDVARPFTPPGIVTGVLKKLDRYPAVNVGLKTKDTMVMINRNNTLERILRRDAVKSVQTPQGFLTPVIREAHQLAIKSRQGHFTDDCSLITAFGLGPVGLVEGAEENIKITTPFDVLVARSILQSRRKNGG